MNSLSCHSQKDSSHILKHQCFLKWTAWVPSQLFLFNKWILKLCSVCGTRLTANGPDMKLTIHMHVYCMPSIVICISPNLMSINMLKLIEITPRSSINALLLQLMSIFIKRTQSPCQSTQIGTRLIHKYDILSKNFPFHGWDYHMSFA